MGDGEEATERLRRQRDDLELLNQVMRHDIRNTLQIIQAYTELLADHVDESGQEYLDTIRDNTESAVALTTTAGELAQVTLREEVDSQRVPLDQVLGQQVDEARSSHRNAVITVSGHIPAVEVLADGMLRSVFRNLLENAITHNDKTPPEVEVSVAEHGDTVAVRVADNGPGVPDDRKEEIFGKGERGLDSEGAGIGLYLVQSLVDIYGGDVRVEDNDPEGAVFVVELPRAE